MANATWPEFDTNWDLMGRGLSKQLQAVKIGRSQSRALGEEGDGEQVWEM